MNGNIQILRDAVPSGCADHLTLPGYYSETGVPATDLVLVVTGIHLSFLSFVSRSVFVFCFCLIINFDSGRPTSARTVAWATECAADQSVLSHLSPSPIPSPSPSHLILLRSTYSSIFLPPSSLSSFFRVGRYLDT